MREGAYKGESERRMYSLYMTLANDRTCPISLISPSNYLLAESAK